jgi:Flp pilus assembly protein TadG
MNVTLRHPVRPVQADHRRQGGTAVLEAALALPIFITFLLGVVDIGLGVFQTSQATSAAADGARAGIIRYTHADEVGSDDYQAIDAAVRARLVGQSYELYPAPTCVRPNNATVACAAANPDVDRLRVNVRWQLHPISPVGKALAGQYVSGTATMGLVGQPVTLVTTSTTSPTTTTTTPPTTTTSTLPNTTTTTLPNNCTVMTVSASPATVGVNGAGKTSAAVNLTITANGSPACNGLALTINGGPQPVPVALATADFYLFTATIPKNTTLGTAAGPRMGDFNLAPGPWLVVTVS